MEDSLFEVLMYLFHNFVDQRVANDFSSNSISAQWKESGFNMDQYPEIIEPCNDNAVENIKAPAVTTLHYYSEEECSKIDTSCRGLILSIEQFGLISTKNREILIQQLMESESPHTTINEVKWMIREMLNVNATLPQFQLLEDVLKLNDYQQKLH